MDLRLNIVIKHLSCDNNRYLHHRVSDTWKPSLTTPTNENTQKGISKPAIKKVRLISGTWLRLMAERISFEV